MKRLIISALALAALAFTPAQATSPTPPALVIVHGWNIDGVISPDEQAIYQPMIDHFESESYDVHFPALPRTGNAAGDSLVNAQFIKDYIDAEELDSVVLVGHSLGAFVVELYARLHDEGELFAYAQLDGVVGTAGPTGLLCLLNPPDQCKNSAARQLIASTSPPQPPLLAVDALGLPEVQPSWADCIKYVIASHTSVVGHAGTLAHVENRLTNSGC